MLLLLPMLRGGNSPAFDPATHLTFDDNNVDDITKPTLLKLRLKASKTDPFRKGVDIGVGKTNNKLCPVTAVLAYLALRGNGPGFLFRFRVDKYTSLKLGLWKQFERHWG